MTITREFIQGIRESEQSFLRQSIELGKHFADVRKRVADEGGDWSVLKAILKAEILDEEGGEHVKKILERVSNGAGYADLLGLDVNKKNFSSKIPDRPAPSDKPRGRVLGTAAGTTHRAAVSIDGGVAEGEGAATRDLIPAAPSGDQYNEIPDFLRRPLVA